MTREAIFISHATPDDNDFVRWLGSRLIRHGYTVWSDILRLKGGTPFWLGIEDALRQQTIKMIYVISSASIHPSRTGVRNELSVADTMKNALSDPEFIIPVRIDDTPFGDFPIQVHQLNAIDFSRGWGPKFLELLDTLETARVPRNLGDRTDEFERWRSTMASADRQVEVAEERVLTNLLPITELPGSITFFEYEGDNTKFGTALKSTGVPHAHFNRLFVTFARADALQEQLPPFFAIKVRARAPLTAFLEGAVTDTTSPRRDEARKMATFLLREHVERYLESRGLKRHETTSGAAFYFPSGLLPTDKVPYLDASGRRTNKNVVGRSERYRVNWHLAMKVNFALGPPCYVRFKPYVCFSDDGRTAISDAKRTAGIRRGFCRNWWNPQWRQLQQAFCAFLAGGGDSVEIGLEGPERMVLSARLLEVVAARRMPDDLKVAEEPEEPEEGVEDDEDDDLASDLDAAEDGE